MADKKITQLNPLAQADVDQADVAAVVHISANETRKLKVPDLAQAGIRLMPDGTIDGHKIKAESITNRELGKHSVYGGPDAEIALDTITADNIAPNAITASELANEAVDTASIQDAAVTGAKIAANTITVDNMGPDSVGESALRDDSVDTAAIQDDAVTGAKLSPDAYDRGLDLTGDKVGITNSIAPGTQAGITWNAQGLITGSSDPIPPEDLPLATTTEVGAVSVPVDGGLTVSGVGAVSINNTVTPGTHPKITFDEHGLVTAGEALTGDDLPIASDTTLGAVKVPSTSPLEVDADGSLTHEVSGVTAETYPKVQVDEYGHVVAGFDLQASDIPDLSFDQITSGEIGKGVLGNCAVEGHNICDYATAFMQESQPDGEHLGQLWYTPSTAQLRIYARGSDGFQWLPVGFGALQANNLRWLGTYDASTDSIVVVTALGISEGISAGSPFPAASDQLSGGYFLCQKAGNSMTQPSLNGISHDAGDWALCVNEAQGWVHIDAAAAGGGGGGGGSQYLNDLLDVELGGASGPFSVMPAMALASKQILKYDGGSGMWRNTDLIDGGTF